MSEREPITTELRETIRSLAIDDSVLTIGGDDFHRICDAIDAVHAGLERENAELRERLAALDNRSESMHIGEATVTITDELRKWGYGFCGDTHDVVTAIADRIDAEHEAQLNDAFETRNSDENLESDGWIRLPKDADGEYTQVGDVMEWPTTHETFEVVGIGDGTLFYIEDGSEQADWTGASTKRHHHAPTVEDVLREMLDAWGELPAEETNEAIVAEYAAKLQLREDS